jgi:hypothetical protein
VSEQTFGESPEGHERDRHHELVGLLHRIDKKLDRILKGVKQVAIDQETFDTDLAGLVSSVGDLVSAVDSWIAAHPEADFSAEDQSVQDAAAAIKAELDKLNPSVPTPAPEPPPEPAAT